MMSVFKGVYCRDKLHNLPTEIPAGYMINIATTWGAGKHWVGIYTDGQRNTTYFDTFGWPPQTTDFMEFLHSQVKNWVFSTNKYLSNLQKSCYFCKKM